MFGSYLRLCILGVSSVIPAVAQAQTISLPQVPKGTRFYDTTAYRGKAMARRQLLGVLQALKQRLNGKSIVVVDQAKGTKKHIKPAQLRTLRGSLLRVALQMTDPSLQGAEVDFLVPLKKRALAPVTGISDKYGSITIIHADKPRWNFPIKKPVQPKTLKFVTGDKPWSRAHQSIVQSAFARLSARERAYISGIPLKRYRNAIDPGQARTHAGHYIQQGCTEEIRIYDRTFSSDRLIFTGEPKAPTRNSERNVLHEIAHVVAARPLHKLYCQHDRLIDEYNDRSSLISKHERAQELVRQYNRLTQQNAVNGSMGDNLDRLKMQIDALHDKIRQMNARKEAQRLKIAELEAQWKQMRANKPVIKAYMTQLAGRFAPTRYGATSPDESFAEAFSMYKTDPNALRRILPDILAWFEQGKHLIRQTTKE